MLNESLAPDLKWLVRVTSIKMIALWRYLKKLSEELNHIKINVIKVIINLSICIFKMKADLG